mmetsp:Transcript_25426/g.40006  ORF Transcript_25426/g.40006 Transcript_25426/m.40006 type:complete len:223 (-) Transcript_25426:199-867(-)
MTLSISDVYKPSCKRGPKTTAAPHHHNNHHKQQQQQQQRRRRATVDTPCLTRPYTKPRMERRPSLPLKSVQFSELSEVRVFENPRIVTKWYTGQDHQRFKRERISDVVSFRQRSSRSPGGRQDNGNANSNNKSSGQQQATPPSSGSCCPVGLEQLLSTKGMLEAHSSRKLVIQSVLIEQNRQRTFGYRDPDSIAFLSLKLSANAFEGAQKRGKFQEMAKFME